MNQNTYFDVKYLMNFAEGQIFFFFPFLLVRKDLFHKNLSEGTTLAFGVSFAVMTKTKSAQVQVEAFKKNDSSQTSHRENQPTLQL